MNNSQQDELATLFAQRMNFDPDIKKDAQPTAFVSAHYIHPTHAAFSTSSGSEPSRSPPPPYKESLMTEAMAHVLLQNSIDPASLLPSQIQLFANAEYEQRLRLLELWRISPPSYPLDEHLSNTPTSMQQEENLARARYETAVIARGLEAYQRSQLEVSEPMSPIREPGEDAWPPAARMRAASIASKSSRPVSQAEPYMTQGYCKGTQPHLDPVYASYGLWQAPQAMENQYGSLMQMRNHADWTASHDREQKWTTNDDDDMVM